MNQNFQIAYTPEKDICIDETMVPFRGRLNIKQYIPRKSHKYGLKLFKLCVKGGYTWNIKVYAGKEATSTHQELSTRVVLEVISSLLTSGRTLYTDNLYIGVMLAHELIKQQTHLVGTLRKNRKFNPKPVVTKKLKRGEMVSLQSNTDVIVSKWKDKRDVLFLSTKSVPELQEVATRRGVALKPSTILEYNAAKSFIDVSDQIASYASTIRKGVMWYRKLAFELLTNISVVNAHITFKSITGKNDHITMFRENLSIALIFESSSQEDVLLQTTSPGHMHVLQESGNKRSRFNMCYSILSAQYGRAHAAKHSKKVTTKCVGCKQIKYMSSMFFFQKPFCYGQIKVNTKQGTMQ